MLLELAPCYGILETSWLEQIRKTTYHLINEGKGKDKKKEEKLSLGNVTVHSSFLTPILRLTVIFGGISLRFMV